MSRAGMCSERLAQRDWRIKIVAFRSAKGKPFAERTATM